MMDSTSPSLSEKVFGFENAGDYFSSLFRTPRLAVQRMGYVRPIADFHEEASEGNQLARSLNWMHVLMLGTGCAPASAARVAAVNASA